MKTSLLSLCFSLIISVTMFAQITRSGSFVANMPGTYPISGDANLIFETGTITIDFLSNFSTVQGITLEIFLAKSNTLNLNTDIKISDMPLDAGSSLGTPISGPFSFNVPPGVNTYDFDNILVQCTSANILWGHVNLCEKDLIISMANLPSGNYRAEETITSNYPLDDLSNIIFEAANSIQLDQEFSVPANAEFNTIVGTGCVIE